jgi:hypothetical protein
MIPDIFAKMLHKSVRDHEMRQRMFIAMEPNPANAKAPVIWDIIQRADDRARRTGREPGPNDA